MASFTMALWEMLELKPPGMTDDEFIGLDEYPIFNNSHRETLNKKITDHFLYQEIGQETIELFRFTVKRRLNEVMPYYNQLYETTLLNVDPLWTTNLVSKSDRLSEQTSTGTAENETKSDVDSVAKNVASLFPQMMLAGNADYATNGADSNSQTESTASALDSSESNSSTSDTAENTTQGYQGHGPSLLQAARAAIINVDMMVVAELDPCFMLVWRNGDDYLENKGRFLY